MSSASASSGNDILTGWFFSLFAQCEKAPATEGDLNFDQADRKKKQKKVAASSGQDTPRVLRRYTVIIGSACGKMKKSGLAYRNSKSADDKVKGEPKRAKWGDVVEGVDQGDGWLKVGEHFLPMQRKGISVLALVADDVAKAPPSRMSQQQQPWFARPSVGTWNQQIVKFSPAPALQAEDVVTASSSALQEDLRLPQTSCVADCFPATAPQLAKAPLEASRAVGLWSQRPSVCTWLQRPQGVWTGKALADGPGVQLEVVDEKAQPVEAAKASGHDEVDWRLLPSVGTWMHPRTRPRFAPVEVEQKVEKAATEMDAPQKIEKLGAEAKLNSLEDPENCEAPPVALAVER